MKRFLLCVPLALAVLGLAQERAAANGFGPFGFTVGGAGSLSLYAAPIFGAPQQGGDGPYYPGYSHAGCGRKGMVPAYAYFPPDYGYGGYPQYPPAYAPAAPAPAPAEGEAKRNAGNAAGAAARAPAPASPTPGAAYYPQAGYGGYPGYGGYGYGAFPYAPAAYGR